MLPSKKEGGSDPDIKLTDTDKHIVEARLKNSAITIIDIAGSVGMPRSGVQYAIVFTAISILTVLLREALRAVMAEANTPTRCHGTFTPAVPLKIFAYKFNERVRGQILSNETLKRFLEISIKRHSGNVRKKN